MADEWREINLRDIARIRSGKRPLVVVETRSASFPIPVIGGSGIMGFTREALFDQPILITGRVGTLGQLHYIKEPSWPSDNTLVITPADQIRLDLTFFYYALLPTLSHTVQLNRGSSNPLVTQKDLGQMSILLPALPEQRAIAHILGTLDDKIELLRRMSETLEEMAQAVFKAWFVDFVPVRAKMEGRWKRGQSLPGLPAHLYEIFPNRLVPSELGEIPEGWEVGMLGDLANVTSGKRPNKTFTTPKPEASIPLWGGNGPMAYVPQPLFTQPILLTGRVGTLGSVFRISSPSWPSDNTLVVLPHKQSYFEYLYFAMKRIDFDALNRGSTQPLLTQTDLKTHPIVIPDENALSQFHQFTSTLFARVDLVQSEAHTLAALRDALLPKLIRGEIRVKDVEQLLKERRHKA